MKRAYAAVRDFTDGTSGNGMDVEVVSQEDGDDNVDAVGFEVLLITLTRLDRCGNCCSTCCACIHAGDRFVYTRATKSLTCSQCNASTLGSVSTLQ